jgi:hypothetical protein
MSIDAAAKAKPRLRQETVAQEPAAPEPVVIELKGHVDAVDHGRVFGWAWSPNDPQTRLDVVLLVGEDEFARATADKPRIDLRRNAVGDGAYAFDLAMPAEAGDREVRLVARHPGGGELELILPGEGGKGLPAVASSAFGIALDRIDFLMTRLHRLQSAHHVLTKEVKEVAEGLAPSSDDTPEITLDQRLTEIDTVLVRLDRTLAEFDMKLQLLSRKHIHGVAPQLLGLAGIIGLIVGIGVTIAFGR